MGRLTFKGGVHPYDGKALSKDKTIEELLPKGECVFPLSMHIGAPAEPVVKKGDYVLAGQLIAAANGFISANIHSSVSGTVKAIEPRFVPTGAKVNSIVIDNDQKYDSIDYAANVKPLDSLSKEDIISIVKDAGVVGMGGAGFPTNVKLSPKNPEKIDYVIVNGAECEPYLTSDYRRMIEEPDKLIEGLKIVLRLFDNAKGYIAIEDNKPEAIKLLSEKVKNDDRIEVKPVKTKYPQGGERMLAYALTKRKINSKMLPADQGCIIHNVDTIVAIYNAVIEGKPLTKRILTVTGDNIKEPRNFYVCVGTNYREVAEAAGGFVEEPKKLISGGPMMGFAMTSLDVPVVKGSSSLLAIKKDDTAVDETACIRCGRCISVCPERLMPGKLATLASKGNMDAFVANHGMECFECGSCTYVCPAKNQLAQRIKTMRKQVMARRRK